MSQRPPLRAHLDVSHLGGDELLKTEPGDLVALDLVTRERLDTLGLVLAGGVRVSRWPRPEGLLGVVLADRCVNLTRPHRDGLIWPQLLPVKV